MTQKRLDSKAIKFLEKNRVSRIGSISEKGFLHIVPICHVVSDENIFFSTPMLSKKVKNMRVNDNVTISCDYYDENWIKSEHLMINGKSQIIAQGKEYDLIRKLIYQKYPQCKDYAPIRENEEVIIKIYPLKSYHYKETDYQKNKK